MNQSRIVADTSVIINGELVSQIESGTVRNSEVIIPQAVFDELQAQASTKKEQGFVGLEKISTLKRISEEFGLTVSTRGDHPLGEDIERAGEGRIDAMIADIARDSGAVLYTSDRVQHLVAQAAGIDTVFLRAENRREEPSFLKYFDKDTMSIHLKEGLPPLGKRGGPGSFRLEQLAGDPLTRADLESMAGQILDAARAAGEDLEISLTGASVVQHGEYRIAITHPPFSDSFEITIVHPIVRMSLGDYQVSEGLMKRFSDRAEGIVISGAPGSGKSTLASGLANFYHSQGKIVKTFESPRDLQVEPGITQYSKLDGSFDNTADILLLVRPDYTVFDEVRRKEDFATFADLRLTGVGMVGVVHANSPLDAIQRFIGKIELGIIPSVLDTVVFVKEGRIEKVYDLELKVKVPSGMTESDLARPVIEIKNFEDQTLEHEIYTFGEENVIVPVGKNPEKAGIAKLAEDKLRETFRRYDPDAEVDLVSDSRVKVTVAERAVPALIGRGGSNIGELEKSLRIHVDVVPRKGGGEGGGDRRGRGRRDDQDWDDGGRRGRGRRGRREDAGGGGLQDGNGRGVAGEQLRFTVAESKGSLMLNVGRRYASRRADLLVAGDRVGTERIGRNGQIKIPSRSGTARAVRGARSRDDVEIVLSGP